jgi:hypothetical protein
MGSPLATLALLKAAGIKYLVVVEFEASTGDVLSQSLQMLLFLASANGVVPELEVVKGSGLRAS